MNGLGTEAWVTPSKSAAHRALCLAALADGRSAVGLAGGCDDVSATLDCLERSGLCTLCVRDDRVLVTGGHAPAPTGVLPARASGATLRLLLPLMLTGEPFTFSMEGRLSQRPLDAYKALCDEWRLEGGTLRARGTLKSGAHTLPGNVSSQFASGLLMALARLPGDSVIRFDTPPESRGYIDMTLEAMAAFGASAAFEGDCALRVPGGQRYRAGTYAVEGDWSYGAYMLAAGALAGGVRVRGLRADSLQPDRSCVGLLERMGARVCAEPDAVSVGGAALRALSADLSPCPDLAPTMAALCARADGTSRLYGLRRLRYKESDRLLAITAGLTALGARVCATDDGLTIQGVRRLTGGTLDAMNDHRIAMMGALCALGCENAVRVLGATCAAKSAPRALHEAARVGGLRLDMQGRDAILSRVEGSTCQAHGADISG